MPDLVENDNDHSYIPLVVRVSKRKHGPCLEFGCTAFAEEIAIDTLSIKSKILMLLRMIRLVMKHLNSRIGMRTSKRFSTSTWRLGGYSKPSTTIFLINKDNRRYLIWLRNLKKFLEICNRFYFLSNYLSD